ncbi:hypothetical protein GCM10025870_08270 [Agromyces marinus]|uniref:ABC transmembrane type-1 domain-containing protein n=1 Tax=Agromyces marinus TaxID=1389020 RepID=A0ABM8GZ27_9MICO|nr:hypothetical protein [Agromyces marinus]BDZ53754.1 hypothetical protein GCM10025870_08270 [Agromyces marinus]
MKNLTSLYRELLAVLPEDARKFFVRYAGSLALLSILDAASLALLAAVITPLVAGTSVTLPLFGEVEGVGLIAMIVLVCFLVVLKGAFAVLLLWWATRRFSRFELETGSRLFNAYIEAPWVVRLRKNSTDLVRIVDSSVGATIAGVLLPGASLIGEAFSFVVVIVVLAIVQPVVALTAFIYLGIVALVLSFWITRRARQAGRVNLKYTLRSSRLITEMVGALKEVTLRGKSAEVGEVVRENRVHTTRARANYQFLSQVPRYVLEAAIIGGFVLVGAVGWITGAPPRPSRPSPCSRSPDSGWHRPSCDSRASSRR